MNKYVLLVVLNSPFIFLGILRAVRRYNMSEINLLSLLARLVFWVSVLTGLIFANNIYIYLSSNGLTNSPPLSLADVVLTTGVIFCIYSIIGLYARLDKSERRATELHEKLSMYLSKDNIKR